MADPALSRSPLTLDDLLADLAWPKLLRAGKLALRPARVGLGAFFLIGCGLLLSLANRIDGDPDHAVLQQYASRMGTDARVLASSLLHARWGEAAFNLVDLFVSAPAECLRAAPWAVAVVVPLLLLWTVLIGGAISRSAATELAWCRTTAWPAALALSISRRRSLVGSVLLPVVAVWAIAIGMVVASWALFNLPVLRAVGGLAWGLFVIGGLIAAVLMLGMLLGHMLLVPAVVCEGADTIDAVQHAYSMALSRPVRLLGYVLILAAQAIVLGAVVALVLGAAVRFATVTAEAGADDTGDAVIAAASAGRLDGSIFALFDQAAPRPASERAASAFVRIWAMAFLVAAAGVAVSYWWCASTALFLVMRRVCDGQELSELWSPGMVAGTVVPSIAAPAASQAIVDNGPADEG